MTTPPSDLTFLKTKGTHIVNESGDPVLLRGVNLGNWFLPEGYMWKFPHELSSAKKMEALFTRLIGPDKAHNFWKTFFDRYTQENDIRQIAAEGYNSIRLPLNYRLFMDDDGNFIEANLQRIDHFLDLCEKHRLYVIIDLHAAPGGQTGTNIDDSDGFPHLFTDPQNEERSIAFWRGIAERYRDRAVVGGYDLLNEPLPQEHSKFNDALIALYKKLTQAIREVDSQHIIIVECAHWATNFRIFTEKWDDNLVIQFHKYWNPTDYRYIRDYLNIRETLNVPLWMGESGENNLDWFASSFQMLEDFDISWCFWPWKKMETFNNPCSIKMPEGWEKITQAAQGECLLEAEEAERILNQYLDNILFENCDYRPEVVNAMMRRIPFRIPAEAYGMKGVGRSYFFKEKVTTHLNIRREEGANLKFINGNDAEYPSYKYKGKQHHLPEDSLCLTLQQGDWVTYEINALGDTPASITAHLSALSKETHIELWLNSEIPLTSTLNIDQTWQQQLLAAQVHIPHGKHCLKVIVKTGSISLDWIEFQERPRS
ncbi:cellulase family glycosylhydrolase [Kiritimatiellota bacterium B12222]|nr:cellulase family glycosylhydrolase [Kiritimatiellota bacterium B12222]